MLRRVRTVPIHFYLWLKRRRAMGLRLVLCWLIGLFALNNDEISGHDQRFQLRGNQQANPSLVMVILKPSDLRRLYDSRTQSLMTLNEITDITDGFYWDKRFWRELLVKILSQNPKSVGVSLYFGDNVGSISLTPEEQDVFLNTKVFWSSTVNSLDRALLPAFANETRSNLGSHELNRDDDGVVRRVQFLKGEQAHIAEKLSGIQFKQNVHNQNQSSLLLNYRGTGEVFTTYSISEILSADLPADALANKIVLIGAETNFGGQFMTPLGSMNRAEILGHIVDNLMENRWIVRWPAIGYDLLLLVFTFLTVFIIMTYPQSVVLIFYLGLILVGTVGSLWVFDTFYLWIPITTPIVILGTVWFIFVGYQASKIERTNFRLQQDQKNLLELEQLKNNFVSLISHDLKTPIAKIQGIVDRLMRDTVDVTLRKDLKSLESYSDELNRYIQSILNLLRVESRYFKLNKEAADLNETIEQAVEQITPLAQEKNIIIQRKLEPLFSIEFDATLIKEVLINLIENAVKYSPPGRSIILTSEEIESGVKVSIEDHGEGIPEDELPKIWGKFVRGKDQNLKSKGSGLGLYLVKYFIELHGGQVKLSSRRVDATLANGPPGMNLPEEGHSGTTVSFTLPFESQG